MERWQERGRSDRGESGKMRDKSERWREEKKGGDSETKEDWKIGGRGGRRQGRTVICRGSDRRRYDRSYRRWREMGWGHMWISVAFKWGRRDGDEGSGEKATRRKLEQRTSLESRVMHLTGKKSNISPFYQFYISINSGCRLCRVSFLPEDKLSEKNTTLNQIEIHPIYPQRI